MDVLSVIVTNKNSGLIMRITSFVLTNENRQEKIDEAEFLFLQEAAKEGTEVSGADEVDEVCELGFIAAEAANIHLTWS
jgi:hypothetical protein